jgi:hypothetical protein
VRKGRARFRDVQDVAHQCHHAADRPARAHRLRRQLDWPPPGGNLRRPPSVAAIDGSKLDIDFEKAGREKVLDSFIQPT